MERTNRLSKGAEVAHLPFPSSGCTPYPTPFSHTASILWSFLNLGMITLQMWSKFKKVDLGKRAGYRHWICAWHHLGREFPGFRTQRRGLLEGEVYSITVNLSLSLPPLSPSGIVKGKPQQGHLKYVIQGRGSSFPSLRIIVAVAIYFFCL